MNYEIRAMLPDDCARVLEIFRQGIEGGNATFEQDVPTWEAWDINHLNTSRFVIADESENVVGWCALTPISRRECYRGVAEVSVYIDNTHQRLGLGNVLLQKLILDSEEHGFWTLQSGIFPENQPSVALHQKHGFRIVGKREKIGFMNGLWRDVLLMERRSDVIGVN